MAVRKVQVSAGDRLPLPLLRKAAHLPDHHAHIPFIGPRVHGDGAAERAGNAMGKLQPGKPLLHSEGRQAGEKNAAPRGDGVALRPQAVQAADRLQDKPVVSPVRHQKVASVAHIKWGDAQSPGTAHRGLGLLLRDRQGHEPRGPADPEGGVPAHELVFPQLQPGTDFSEFLYQREVSVHIAPPKRIGITWLLGYYSRNAAGLE